MKAHCFWCRAEMEAEAQAKERCYCPKCANKGWYFGAEFGHFHGIRFCEVGSRFDPDVNWNGPYDTFTQAKNAAKLYFMGDISESRQALRDVVMSKKPWPK